jgi:hypothetical protein
MSKCFVPPAGLGQYWPTHVAVLRKSVSPPDLNEPIWALAREIVAASDRWDEWITQGRAENGLRSGDDEKEEVFDAVDKIGVTVCDVAAFISSRMQLSRRPSQLLDCRPWPTAGAITVRTIATLNVLLKNLAVFAGITEQPSQFLRCFRP